MAKVLPGRVRLLVVHAIDRDQGAVEGGRQRHAGVPARPTSRCCSTIAPSGTCNVATTVHVMEGTIDAAGSQDS